MYVCLCGDKTSDEIIAAVQAGSNTMDKLKDTIDVCNGCGTCTRLVEKILNETLLSNNIDQHRINTDVT